MWNEFATPCAMCKSFFPHWTFLIGVGALKSVPASVKNGCQFCGPGFGESYDLAVCVAYNVWARADACTPCSRGLTCSRRNCQIRNGRAALPPHSPRAPIPKNFGRRPPLRPSRRPTCCVPFGGDISVAEFVLLGIRICDRLQKLLPSSANNEIRNSVRAVSITELHGDAMGYFCALLARQRPRRPGKISALLARQRPRRLGARQRPRQN